MKNGDDRALVLVVEDDADVRQSLMEVLEDHGYRCLPAANGAEALTRMRDEERKPCVILLDLMLPVMDGWQFRARQRRDRDLREIPVVILSAHADVENVAVELEAPASLRKPVSIVALLSTIGQFCKPA